LQGRFFALYIRGKPNRRTCPVKNILSSAASIIFTVTAVITAGCKSLDTPGKASSFGDDIAFLRKYADVIVLSEPSPSPVSPGRGPMAQVAVIPGMQARVMTSTAEGMGGNSFGWINRELVVLRKKQPHINVFGGEDRFWIGPEGGQFSVFFKKGDPFDLEHWQTPDAIDWGGWDTVSHDKSQAAFRKIFSLENYSGTSFDIVADRTITVFDRRKIEKTLGIVLGGRIKAVGYETDNRIKNNGKNAWKKDSGLLSVWILGMFNPSPSATVVIPFRTDPGAKNQPVVNDTYFGKVPADRLKVDEKGLTFFKADGQYRSKIGVPPLRAKDVMGSYDADIQCLTIVKFSLPDNVPDYVNSLWEIQKEPYRGDEKPIYSAAG